MTSRGHGLSKVLLAALFATLDALLGAVGGDIRWHSLTAARDHLTSSLCWTRHDRLIPSGMLGGDVTRRLECVPK
jgi:hypothetical protein